MPGQRATDKPVPVAYVVFKKASALKAALQLDTTVHRDLPEPSAETFGLEKWKAEYDAERPAASVLQAKIDADLNMFDDERAREKATRLAMDGKEDEEGWTTIVKGGKMVNEDGEGNEGDSVNPKKRAKKDRELQNFYRFQQKDARKDQIAALRKKFDLDKMRITQMKGDRKFRPY